MKARDAILILVGGAMLACIVTLGVRIAGQYPDVRWEIGRVKRMHVDDATRRTLADLKHDVVLTYYISPREHLPSSMKRMEQDVTEILAALQRASHARVTFQIVHPETNDDAIDIAARQKVAPYRVRSVTRDSYDEQTVWSAMHMAYGPNEPAVINGVSAAHLPRLQSLIAEHLRQMDQPRRPVFAIAADGEFEGVAGYLASLGDLHRIDLESGRDIPDDVDVLFWLNPQNVTPEIVRQVDLFLARGGSVVIAGSPKTVAVETDANGPVFTFADTGFDADALLSAFGLQASSSTVLDDFCHELPGVAQPTSGGQTSGPVSLKFLPRCVGPNQDFRTMRDHPNGNLLFEMPMALTIDTEVVNDRAYTATVLATTSDRTSVGPSVSGRKRISDLAVLPLEPAPKLPLLLWMRPIESWRGSVVVCASASPFHDRWFTIENYAHRRLVDALTRTLASPERKVIRSAGIEPPTPLPQLRPFSRTIWRIICIGLIPMVLAVVGFRRWLAARRTETAHIAPTRFGLVKVAAPACIAFAAIAGIAAIVSAFGLKRDFTHDQANILSAASENIARLSTSETAVQAVLYCSGMPSLPPAMRPLIRDLQQILRDFRSASGGLSCQIVHPEDLPEQERLALAEQGIQPIRAMATNEEITTVRTMYCTLELRRGDRREVLPFPDAASFEHQEFRITFALWRLQTGAQPHVAFAADRPRLSPAEALQDFQQQGRHAPTGTDVYSAARQALERLDFRVTSINPQSPVIPSDANLIIWLQPRRTINSMLEATLDRMANGVPAIIAAQHFNIQARQYRAERFRTVYWPQPQEPDVDRVYFPQIGVNLDRALVFDELRANLPLETQVNRGEDEREYAAQESALPFFIRVPGHSGEATSIAHPILQGLGDLVFPFANAVRVDQERLSELGLRATTLISSSDRTWTYQWQRGWLPDEALAGTATVEPGQIERTGGQPLAVLLEGRFPKPATPLTSRATDDVSPVDLASADDVGSSRLILIGCSEMFKNERIRNTQFRSDHFLINAAAWLALPPELASIAAHRSVKPGLEFIEPQQRLVWRGCVIGAGPVMMLLIGAVWFTMRRGGSSITRLAMESDA